MTTVKHSGAPAPLAPVVVSGSLSMGVPRPRSCSHSARRCVAPHGRCLHHPATAHPFNRSRSGAPVPSRCAVPPPCRAPCGPAREQHRLHEPAPVHAAAGVDDSDQQVDRFGAHPVRAEADSGEGRGGRRVVRILADARHHQVPRHPKALAPSGGEDAGNVRHGMFTGPNQQGWSGEQVAPAVPSARNTAGIAFAPAILDFCHSWDVPTVIVVSIRMRLRDVFEPTRSGRTPHPTCSASTQGGRQAEGRRCGRVAGTNGDHPR